MHESATILKQGEIWRVVIPCRVATSMNSKADLVIIGAGPAGSAAALTAARAGARVVVFEKSEMGRDKICGDGLTPRAVAALLALGLDPGSAHKIDGLRMVSENLERELLWPTTGRFPNYGGVWPRRSFDKFLINAAIGAGADVRFSSTATPVLDDDGRVRSVRCGLETMTTDFTILATGAQGEAARILGALRDPYEPFGLAIRTYATSPRHAEGYLEACLSLKDADGKPIPGYGWIFPAGDGTVNVGVGALSTMKGFKRLNLNTLLDRYASMVKDSWGLGDFEEKPRAWRLPMSSLRRHGPGWVAVGDAAGLVNPMNGEGIDYALESGTLAAELFLADPSTAPGRFDEELSCRFDPFLRTGRRFSFLIGHPWILRSGLKVAVGSRQAANITLAVMGNLLDSSTPGAPGRVLKVADTALRLADPVLRRYQSRD